MIRPYSEATVELAARAGFASERARVFGPGCGPTWDEVDEVHRVWARESARAGLDALAAASLLLPEGAETRTEHEIEWRKIGQTRGGVNEIGYVDLDAAALAREVEAAASFGSEMVSHRWRKVTTYADGSTLTGAWVEVDAVRLAEGESKAFQDPSVSVEETPQ